MNLKNRNRWIVWLLVGLLLAGCGPASTSAPLQGTLVTPAPPDTLPLAAGGSHTCALTSAGGVQCWGDNASGQLGDGTTTSRSIPVSVSGLTSGVASLSAGGTFTCVLMQDGGVKCWGSNIFGELGNGTTTEQHTPVDVTGLPGKVKAITSGEDHTCALTAQGQVWCWGGNGVGQLGDGSNDDHNTPVEVSGLPGGVQAIVAGKYFTCALMTGGTAACWGNNVAGQLAGEGTPVAGSAPKPVQVSGLRNAIALAAGNAHACALTVNGGVVCWGVNNAGQLGDGTTAGRHALVKVKGLASGIIALAANYDHTCALSASGMVKCWGSNQYGELGDGTTTMRPAPVSVSKLPGGVIALAAGMDHTCAMTSAHALLCWGRNQSGQLGDGTLADRPVPVSVTGFVP